MRPRSSSLAKVEPTEKISLPVRFLKSYYLRIPDKCITIVLLRVCQGLLDGVSHWYLPLRSTRESATTTYRSLNH